MKALLLAARGSRHRALFVLPLIPVLVLVALLSTSAIDSLAATGAQTSRAAADLASLARADHGSTAQAQAAAKKAKKTKPKKKKPKKKTCQVKMFNNKGKLVVVKHRVWAYRYVKVHGKRKRVIRHVLVPLYASCPPPPCVKQKVVNGKIVGVTHVVVVQVLVPRRGRLVKVRRRVSKYVIVACPKTTTTPPPPLGTPVTLTVEPASTATLDFIAFQRQASLSGGLNGFVVGGFKLGSPNQIILTGGTISIGQTAIFIDDVCNGQVSAAIRTGNPSTITLDPTRQSTSTVAADGSISSVIYTIIRLPLELRNGDDGCNQPYLTTGYDQEQATLFLGGKLTGLTGAQLQSAPEDIEFGACLGLGPETEPCNGFEIPIDVLVSTNLTLGVTLG